MNRHLPKAIAIDGPAASGKSTVAEIIARRIGYLFFDTGIMYRAVTVATLMRSISPADEQKVSDLAKQIVIDIKPPSVKDERKCDVSLDGQDVTWEIRRREVEADVSQISAYPEVRQAMTEQQRRIGSRGGVVMVGRDIGTVVLPNAELKVYLEASVEERARRRYLELVSRKEAASYEAILVALRRRDEIDSNRAVAPLKPAADAVIINTEGMTIEQVVNQIEALIDAFAE